MAPRTSTPTMAAIVLVVVMSWRSYRAPKGRALRSEGSQPGWSSSISPNSAQVAVVRPTRSALTFQSRAATAWS